MNEDQILLLFQNGDQKGFKAVFELFYQGICNFSKRLTEDNQEGEDIAITSFHKLWDRKENFQTLTNIKSFLYITTRNACLNFIKARNRKHTTGEDSLFNLTQKENDADRYTIRSEILRAIDEEIQKLPPLPRQVFKLRYLEGLSVPEVANRLNISINSVSVNTHKAMKFLRSAPIKRKLQLLLLLLLHFMGGLKKYF
jgi:RNA polymerase sigma-70 factor (ECF subfamily)